MLAEPFDSSSATNLGRALFGGVFFDVSDDCGAPYPVASIVDFSPKELPFVWTVLAFSAL